MTYNAGERRDVRRLEKAAKLAETQRRDFITGIMSLAPGRSWMLERLESCHIFSTSFSSDQLQMAFMEGERSQGLQLLNDIMQSCPDQYILMMRERNERDASRNAATERSSSSDPNGGDTGREPTDGSGGTSEGPDSGTFDNIYTQ